MYDTNNFFCSSRFRSGEKTMQLVDLPEDVLLIILDHLSPEDRFSLQLAYPSLKPVISSKSLWIDVCFSFEDNTSFEEIKRKCWPYMGTHTKHLYVFGSLPDLPNANLNACMINKTPLLSFHPRSVIPANFPRLLKERCPNLEFLYFSNCLFDSCGFFSVHNPAIFPMKLQAVKFFNCIWTNYAPNGALPRNIVETRIGLEPTACHGYRCTCNRNENNEESEESDEEPAVPEDPVENDMLPTVLDRQKCARENMFNKVFPCLECSSSFVCKGYNVTIGTNCDISFCEFLSTKHFQGEGVWLFDFLFRRVLANCASYSRERMMMRSRKRSKPKGASSEESDDPNQKTVRR